MTGSSSISCTSSNASAIVSSSTGSSATGSAPTASSLTLSSEAGSSVPGCAVTGVAAVASGSGSGTVSLTGCCGVPAIIPSAASIHSAGTSSTVRSRHSGFRYRAPAPMTIKPSMTHPHLGPRGSMSNLRRASGSSATTTCDFAGCGSSIDCEACCGCAICFGCGA